MYRSETASISTSFLKRAVPIIGPTSCCRGLRGSFSSGIRQRKVAVKRGPGDAQRLADLIDAQAAIVVQRFAVRTRGWSAGIGLRPPLPPRARAAAKPDRVRSWIRRRSNYTRLEKMLNFNSPEAVDVSTAPPESDQKPMPLPSSSSTRLTKCDIERPRRSSRHTTSVSPGSRALTQASSSGRLPRTPDALSAQMSASEHRRLRCVHLRSQVPLADADASVADQSSHAEFPLPVTSTRGTNQLLITQMVRGFDETIFGLFGKVFGGCSWLLYWETFGYCWRSL